MKTVIAAITYNQNTAQYLPYFIKSIFAQSNQNFSLWIADNSEVQDNPNAKFFQAYPQVRFEWLGGNRGYGAAYNKLLEQARAERVDNFILLNPDVVLDENFVQEIIRALDSQDKIAAVAPLILKWDFKNKGKTNIVDSQGIGATEQFRFFDRGQGLEYGVANAHGQAEEVIGFTGAAVALKMVALESIRYQAEYFDENMFMYKEDVDLSLRLILSGWKISYNPGAVAYHDRTAAPLGNSWSQLLKNRQNKSRAIREWSYLNQWILFFKFWPFLSSGVRFKTFSYQMASLVFCLFREPYLLKQFIKACKLRPDIKKKQQKIKQNSQTKKINFSNFSI